jgi:hypothetical protein
MDPLFSGRISESKPRASWRSVLLQTALTLAIWYGAFRAATTILGQRHLMVYVLQFVLFPLVVILGVRLVRAIMSSVLNPDI